MTKVGRLDPRTEQYYNRLSEMFFAWARRDMGGVGYPVGCENIGYLWKWDILRELFKMANTNLNSEEIAKCAKELVRKWINHHNNLRKEVEWKRWAGCCDGLIDEFCGNLKTEES